MNTMYSWTKRLIFSTMVCLLWNVNVITSAATPCSEQADPDIDKVILAQAGKAIQDFGKKKASFAEFQSAMERLTQVKDRDMASRLLVSAIDYEDNRVRDEDGGFNAEFQTRYPCVGLLLRLGRVSVVALMQELKMPRSPASSSLAQHVLLRILGVEETRAAVEREVRRIADEKRNLAEVLDRMK